ncbi:MAG TPA: ComEA family DNA-binding protein [bacterium]
MRWPRGEQLALLLGIFALVAGGIVLLAVRRPAPPIRMLEPPAATEIVVQVDGEVVHPGLYRLSPGARVADAIRVAGGPTAGADLEAVNAARPLRDGERVHVAARGREPQTEGSSRAVNVNTASAPELESLPGIGPVLARRIADHRRRHGPFRRLEDLLQVQGIGPALLRRLRAVVRFD